MNILNMKKLMPLIAVLFFINACVQDDDYGIPPGAAEIPCSNEWVANMTIPDLFSTVDNAGSIVSFEAQDSIFEGYVVSSDSTGNFFKTVSVQDNLSDPTKGLQIEMDAYDLYQKFPLGSKIRVKLTDLYAGYDRGTLKIGQTYEDGGEIRVGRMAQALIDDHVKKTCDEAETITPVTFPDIQSAIESGIINTLIKIENVQFQQTGITYADATNHVTVNLTLEGATAGTHSQHIVLRNSGYATFAGEVVPEGSGSITVVLSAYDANNNGSITPSEYQLFIRDTNDVQFNNPRYGSGGGSGDGTGPIGGGNAAYESCVNEGFESFDTGDSEFGPYINDAAVGSRYWEVKDFGGNKYIQMSSFNSDDAANVTYFIVPVNFSDADKFSFKTKDGYNNGNVLSVYYSTDYQIGGDISTATLNDITASFTISSGNTSGYGVNFIDSGEYSLSSVSGNGAIIFKYQGSQSVTTTMQIEDIKVVDNDNPDCGGEGPGPGTGGGIGGNNATFDNCLSEGFSSATDYQTEFSKYENYALEGTRYWEARSFGGNKYIQFSAFNSTDAANKAYFIVPVNFSEADGFSFKSNDGYNNGDALKVYYSTNYQIGTDIAQATLVDITSSFTLSTGNTSGYGASFTDSGVYDLSALSGNGFIMFYYEGSGNGVTTTFQIDDITFTDNEDPDCDGGGNPNPGDGGLAFAGSDFEDYAAFLAGLNQFGIKDYATQSPGNGVNGSDALRINTPSTSGNDYVFTALARPGLPSTYSTIKFFVKGTADKSISINLYKPDGTYYKFNLGDVTGNMTVQQSGNNQYTGVINTGGQWAEITLDLSGINDLNTANTAGDFFALKIGKEVPYDIYLDGFTIQ